MQNKDEFIQLYCFGCGLPLQNSDPYKPGFIPKKLEGDSKFLCQRCFRLQHYGEVREDFKAHNLDYKKIIDQGKKEHALFIYLVDCFAFESSVSNTILKDLHNCKLVIGATKRDILPKSVPDEKIKSFISTRLKDFNISPLDIIISSSTKNYNIDAYKEMVKRYYPCNVYVFGVTSVGKSTLVNTFLKDYKNETTHMISTSPYPGTTLDVIRIPLSDDTFIFDTPGILNNNNIFTCIDQKLIKYVMPRKEIKPRVYQLNAKQSLFISNFFKFDFLEGERSNFTIYTSNDLEVARSKLENSDKAFANMITNRQFKLLDRNITSVNDLAEHYFILPESDCDICVSGLLWIKVKGKGQEVKVYAPKNVRVMIRPCKI